SFVETLSGKIAPGILRDKIVLVGINTQSVFDERVTPISRNQRGHELQAMTVNQLLRMVLDGEKPMRWLNSGQQAAWLALWCLLGGIIGYRIRSPWRFAGAIAVCWFGLVVGVWTAFLHGWWIPAVTPALGFIPSTALVVSYISAQERSMRNIL